MNIKTITLCLMLSLLVACSSTQQQTRGSSQQEVAEAKKATVKGSTNNQEARKAFETAVKSLETVNLEDKSPAAATASQQSLSPAEVSLSKAVEIDPSFGKAWFNLGVIRERLGKKEEAKEAYNKAIVASPKLAAPHINLGMMAVEETGDLEAGRPYFDQAVEASKYDTDANSNLSALERERGDIKKAVDRARLSLSGDSLNLDAYANLARAYYVKGIYDAALLVCLNALKIKAERADIHNIAGLVWLKKRDVTEAIRQFRGALQIDPNYVPAMMNLGAVMLSVRNYDRAIELFEKASSLEPKNYLARISAAVAYRAKGDLEMAQKIYDAVQKEDPQNPIVAYNQGVLEQEQYAQNAQRGIGGPDAPEDPVAMMDWQIENVRRSMAHYEKAIQHYNDYLAWERPDRVESRQEAERRISQVQEILQLSAEQIPQLEMQKQEIAEELRMQQEAEQQAQQEGAQAQEEDAGE